MFPGTAVAVTASTDLVVEGAVDFVLFGTKYGGKIVGHFFSRRLSVMRLERRAEG